MKILFYFNDQSNTSEHFYRLISICKYLNLRCSNNSILIISGSNLLNDLNVSHNLNYLKLPTLQQKPQVFYEEAFDNISNIEKIGLRSKMIVEAIHNFKPDVLLVDEIPYGIAGELKEAILTTKSKYTKTKLVLLLRDVIDHPKITISHWKNQGFYHAIEHNYDQVLILGMREIFHASREYEFPTNIQHKVTFCGYVRHHVDYQHIPSVRKSLRMKQTDQLVVVVPTGDCAGYRITANYLQGLALLPNQDQIKSAIFIDPKMCSKKRQILLDVAQLNDRVIIHENLNNLMRYIVSANVLVTTGGYDRICEVFSAATPAVIIPQSTSSHDEFIRIASMRKLGLLRALHPERLMPNPLMQLIWKQLQEDPFNPRLRLDMDALPRIYQYLEQITNPKKQSSIVIKNDRRHNSDRRADRDALKKSFH